MTMLLRSEELLEALAPPRARDKLIGDVPAATPILDLLLQHAELMTIPGRCYRLRHQANGNKDEHKQDQHCKKRAK